MYAADDETLNGLLRWGRRVAYMLTGLAGRLLEPVQDAATDAIVEALRKYDAARGVSFEGYAKWLMRRRIIGACRRVVRQSGRPNDLAEGYYTDDPDCVESAAGDAADC